MRRTARILPVALFLLLATVACQPGAERAGIRLVEGERSQPSFADATLAFEAPERGTLVQDSTVEATLKISGFEPGAGTPGAEGRGIAISGKGQHVHFIVDNEPYRALYDLSEPVEVSGLDEGLHVLRAFPSRQWHESVKGAEAFAMTWFYVRDSTDARSVDPEAPLLTYSRPKGTYSGADSVMVDFYLTNAELGPDGYRVRLTVDDTVTHTIERWAPHYLLGLGAGEHAVRLELLRPDGSVAPGPLSTTERTITVVRGEGQ